MDESLKTDLLKTFGEPEAIKRLRKNIRSRQNDFMSTTTTQTEIAPAPETPGGLTMTNDDQNFGIKGIEHHPTTLKADIVSKEIKAIVKAHKGVFDLDGLTFIRAEFRDERQPYGLARWSAKLL